jgi:protein TonB
MWCAVSLVTAVLPVGAQTPFKNQQARTITAAVGQCTAGSFLQNSPSARPQWLPRAKADNPPTAKKPEAKPPAADALPASPVATDTAAAPASAPAAPPVAAAPPPPAAPTIAAAAPEPDDDEPALAPLRPIAVVEPTIPRELRNEPINATVVLRFTVQPDGSVATPQIVTGNNRRLNRSAIDAIAQWRFEPIQTARLTQVEFEFRQE